MMGFALNFSVTGKLLISAGFIASAAAIWHLLCILGGPSWFAFARAPQQIIESAQQGTMIAPIGTIIVATLMFACTIFCLFSGGVNSQSSPSQTSSNDHCHTLQFTRFNCYSRIH